MINLKIYLAENQFDISKKNPVIGHPKKDAYNTTVKTKLNKAEDIILNTKGLKLLSNEELRNLIIEVNDQEQEKNEKEEYKLIDHFKKYIEKCRKPKTAEVYHSSLKYLYIGRHTFATIASNKCKISDKDIALC